MIYRLIILNGNRRNEHITITSTPMTIGRAADCEIHLNDPEVALNHAIIVHTPDGLHIRDLDSMNRLLINRKEIHATYPKHGDVLEIGHTRALIQAYVQAAGQSAKDDDEKKERRKSWLIAGGLILFIIGLLVLIPRCERHVTAPRGYEDTTESAPFFLDESQPKSKRSTTKSRKPEQPAAPQREPESASSPAKQVPAAVQPSPQAKAEPENISTPPTNTVASPVTNTPPQPKEIPPPAKPETAAQPTPPPTPPAPPPRRADTPRHTTAPNPASDRLITAQKELQEAEQTLNGNKPTDPNAKPPAPLPSGSLIKILNTDMVKFPETDKFQEMRLLTIHLASKESLRELNPDAVRVEVVFAEKNPTTGQINPTLPGGTPADLTIQGKWPGTEQKSVVASYIVPVSATTTNSTNTNYQSKYYGFIIRVYYQGTLQDELSQPKDLPR